MEFSKHFVIAIALSFSVTAFAQLDPSSKVLLRSSGPTPSMEDLDSSRYRVKPSLLPTESQAPVPPKPKKSASVTVSLPTAAAPDVVASSSPSTDVREAASPPAPAPSPGPSSVSDRVQVYLLGGDGDSIQEYRRMLHPSDTRLNLLELSLAPSYGLLQSRSSYWPRNYLLSVPMVNVGARIWLSPFFGLQASYLSSLNGQVSTSPSGLNQTSFQTNRFGLGLRFRSFFGYSRRAASLVYGLDYEDWQAKISKDASQRTGFETSGFKLVLEANMPFTNSYSTTLGVELAPSLSHRESNGAVGSGNSNRSTMISASLGGKYLFDRKNQVFWRVTQRLEQNAFQGPANAADPVTSSTPTGVMVNQSLTLFEIGFTWGP